MPTPHSLLNQIIVYRPLSTIDGYRTPSYGDAISLKARVEDAYELIRNDRGEEKIAVTRIYVENNGTTVVDTTGQITLPDGSIPPILAVKKEINRAGAVSHFKMWCGLISVRGI
jgi:hypothetical protein